MNRALIFGAGLATTLVLTILVLTGGRAPAPAAQAPRPGEAPLPMLDGVNKPSQPNSTTPAPVSEPPAAPVQN